MKVNLTSLFKNTIFFHLIYFILIYSFTLSIPKESFYTISYSLLAPLNQAFAISLILFLIALPLIWLKPLLFKICNTLIFGSILLILIMDHFVYSIYKFHINGFFINMFFTDFQGFGFSLFTLIKIAFAALFCFFLSFYIPSKIYRFIKTKFAILFVSMSFVLLFVGQGIHAYSHAHNMSTILRFTPAIPWYYPLIAVDKLKRLGMINQEFKEENIAFKQNNSKSFNYPISPLQCKPTNKPNIVLITLESWRFDAMNKEITPNIHKISEEGLTFSEHLSGGNVTTKGLFALFYGISPIYWDDAIAANAEPAFINLLRSLNYDFSILANQDIERTDLKSLFFGNLDNVKSHKDSNSLKGDKALIPSFKKSIEKSDNPFFSFIFFNSTHHSYYYPKDEEKPFTPSKQIEMSSLNNNTDPQQYLNQYFNAAFKIDQYIKEIKDFLIEQNKWDNTILIITGDHGEEFNEQKLNYWGHGSNFSKYQMQVPLIIHWKNKQGVINHRTSHLDVFASIMNETFNCKNDLTDFSSGKNLFDATTRTMIASSYINNAIINKNRIDETITSYVLSYHYEDKSLPIEERSPGLIQKTSDIMSQFK